MITIEYIWRDIQAILLTAVVIGEINFSGNQTGGWENFVNQLGMFTEERADCNTVYINRLMNEGQRIFREAIRKYNDSQSEAGGNALFESEVVAPEEAFKGYIIAKLSKDAVTRIERYCDNKPAKEEEISKFLQPQFSAEETAIVDDKKQLAQTRLKLLEKAVNRLEGDKKKLAATRIKLLSKFLQK